jgi:sulfur-carrier protein adenylyltransferase/sulfurtransferase
MRLRDFCAREDSSARLPPSHAALKEKRIAIVGLGSLGSKVAVSLARSGCRKFLLVDDDLFLPENICRNELSWAAVGIHKAQGVQEAFTLVAADIEADVQTHRLAGQESSLMAAKVLKSAGECDLIVDATANPRVFLRLAAVAQMKRRPLCWGEVFAGGIGGMIARARPGLDPNPQAVRDAFLRYLEQQPPAPYKNATDYDDVDGEPIVADDADVAEIASAMTRMALDTLIEAQPTAFASQVYLICLRPEWVFSGAFDTRAIDVTGDDWGLPQPSEEEKSAAAAILVNILTEELHDRPNPSARNTPDDQSSVA